MSSCSNLERPTDPASILTCALVALLQAAIATAGCELLRHDWRGYLLRGRARTSAGCARLRIWGSEVRILSGAPIYDTSTCESHGICTAHSELGKACGLPDKSVKDVIGELTDTAAGTMDHALSALPRDFPEKIAASITEGAKRRLNSLALPESDT